MRNIIITLFSFFFFLLLLIVLVYVQLGNPTQISKWVFEAYKLKETNALKIKDKKIVIVSGSNSLFGINSKELEKVWHIPVINDAVHAGLGMPYILYKSKKILHKGDIAILPLEYIFYQMTDIPSNTFSDYILSRDPNYYYNLSIIEKIKIIFSISFQRLLRGFQFYIQPLHKTEGVYGIQNINNYGDQININTEQMTKSDVRIINNLTHDKLKSFKLSNEFKFNLDKYILWAQNNDITLIFMPPNHMYFQYYNSDKYKVFLNNIKKYFSERNAIYIGNPYDYMYDKKYYFNTAYHLNSMGVSKRTEQIIKDINKTILEYKYNSND